MHADGTTGASATTWACLMYHGLGLTGSAVAARSDDWFAVAAEDFDGQLRLIDDAGLAGLSIASACASGEPRVGISFDDGLESDYTVATPALTSRGMTATFFVVTGWVGRSGYATWPQLREMHTAGMSIQSHTASHPFLSELSADHLRQELLRSRETIEDQIGAPVDQLALPGGDAPRRRLRRIIAESGYRVVATSRWGRNRIADEEGLTWLRRCTIAGAVAPGRFMSIVEGSRSVTGPRLLREGVLAALRRTLGPSRYARWRRLFINRVLSR